MGSQVEKPDFLDRFDGLLISAPFIVVFLEIF